MLDAFKITLPCLAFTRRSWFQYTLADIDLKHNACTMTYRRLYGHTGMPFITCECLQAPHSNNKCPHTASIRGQGKYQYTRPRWQLIFFIRFFPIVPSFEAGIFLSPAFVGKRGNACYSVTQLKDVNRTIRCSKFMAYYKKSILIWLIFNS